MKCYLGYATQVNNQIPLVNDLLKKNARFIAFLKVCVGTSTLCRLFLMFIIFSHSRALLLSESNSVVVDDLIVIIATMFLGEVQSASL